jgi:hypothetical protein
VEPTEHGFNVELRLSDSRWWTVFGQAGMRRNYRWKVREYKSHFTITDEATALRWRAGVPVLGFSLSRRSGRIGSLSRTDIWGVSPQGRIQPMANYRFNAREGRDLIRIAARQLGLKEKLPRVLWVPFVAALILAVLGNIPFVLHHFGLLHW